jgi:RNA polymerase sigma-70 factor (ECF subfamily)
VNEAEILQRLRDGDHEAFEILFRTHYEQLVGLAERMLRGGGTAEEIVQDVMLELWRRRESLVVTESIRAYLFRSTRNRVLNQLRHQRVVRQSGAGDSARSARARALDTVIEHEIDAAVREAIAALPERCREVFELSRGHGLKYSEIASALGISVKTVEAQMGKALRVLRERLTPWLPARKELSERD